MKRKKGHATVAEMKRDVASHAPALIDDVQLSIVARWRRGVQISYIAKMYQLTVRQVEAVIWVHLYGTRRAA